MWWNGTDWIYESAFVVMWWCRPAGVLYVQLHRLISVLTPSPQRCLAGLHRLLPVLAASAHNQFIAKVGPRLYL
jgi:hypothetical protein